jgi:murein L,D-transpeptidase YcbB/YkuD
MAAAGSLWIGAPALASEPASRAPQAPQIDMIYVDRALAPGGGGTGGPEEAVNPIQQDLLEGLDEYRRAWGSLPQVAIPAGPALRSGSTGPRVQRLRARLGLSEDGGFDGELTEKVRAFQAAHGLPDDGVAGAGTIQALNRGAEHYVRLIEANVMRAQALPAQLGERYIMVDVPTATLWTC